MYFAERLTNLKDHGIDDAGDILEYMDGVKDVIAMGGSFADINKALAALNAGRSKLRTRIVEKSNPAATGPKNLTVVTLDTRASRNCELITAMALDLGADPLSVTRTTQLAWSHSSGKDGVIVGVTRGDKIKPIPVSVKAYLEHYAKLRRGESDSVGGRLRNKINQAVQTGRPVQLLNDELQLFRQIDAERRLTLSDLGLKLGDRGRLKLRTGDTAADIMGMYFSMLGIKEHIPMLCAIAHFARSEPVFITAESPRKDFREWYRILSDYHYHDDPRVLRGLSSAGIVMERTTLTISLPGESEAKPVSGFYFRVPWIPDGGETWWTPEFDEVPRALLLALAQRSEQLPDDPELCRYLMFDGALAYLRDNVLGPRGASLGDFKPRLHIYNRFGLPCLTTRVRLHYAEIDPSRFPNIERCCEPMKVAGALLKRVREAQQPGNGAERQLGDDDLLGMIIDVGLELSNGTIDVAHLFEQPGVRDEFRLPRKIQQVLDGCHSKTIETRFLGLVATAMASSALGGQLNLA